MARDEIDSFIVKFKGLLLSGRNATLVIKSNAGKAEVSLNVVLGDVTPPPDQHLRQSRNGPSRQRRRCRRAEARKASNAEEAKKASDDVVNTDEVIEVDNGQEKDTSPVVHETLKDEFCSDDAFNTMEKERDQTQVEKILVVADCQADWKDEYVIKLVEDKLRMIGINMKAITVNRNIRKCFESCTVQIEPTRRDLIEKVEFPIRRWTMKCIM